MIEANVEACRLHEHAFFSLVNAWNLTLSYYLSLRSCVTFCFKDNLICLCFLVDLFTCGIRLKLRLVQTVLFFWCLFHFSSLHQKIIRGKHIWSISTNESKTDLIKTIESAWIQGLIAKYMISLVIFLKFGDIHYPSPPKKKPHTNRKNCHINELKLSEILSYSTMLLSVKSIKMTGLCHDSVMKQHFISQGHNANRLFF